MTKASGICSVLILLFAPVCTIADEKPTADQIVAEFYKYYPCTSPSTALVLAREHPALVRSLWESDRPTRDRFAAYRLLVATNHKNVVLDALKDHSTEIRRTAVHDLRYAVPKQQLVPIYIGLLRDEFSGVRYNAAEKLAHTPSKEALLPLFELLGDESIEVRSCVLHTLLSWKDPEVTKRLHELSQSASVTISGCASMGLARIANEPVDISRLHRYLAQELSKQTGPRYYGVDAVVGVINAIADKGDSSSLSVLRIATRHEHRYIRETALKAVEVIEERQK